MFQQRTLVLVASILMLTTACGQKGDLYLPANPPPAGEAKKQPVKDPEEKPAESSNHENQLPESDGLMP